MNQMVIRAAELSDSAMLSVLCLTVWTDTYALYGLEPAYADYMLDEFSPANMQTKISSKVVWIAELDSRLVGVMVFSPVDREIETLYMLRRFKGMGIGGAFLRKLRVNVDGAVYLSCWEGNSPAIQFYRAMGLEEAGEDYFSLDGQQHRNIRFCMPEGWGL